jgi:hypothetical protein
MKKRPLATIVPLFSLQEGVGLSAGLKLEISLKLSIAAGHGNSRSFGNAGVAWEF